MNGTKQDMKEPNPSGLCQCGCGQLAPIARKTRTYSGHVQGQPVKYIRGHAARGKPSPFRGRKHTPETRAKISAAHVGKTLDPETRAKISAAKKGTGRGPSNPRWKGGRTLNRAYVLVYLEQDDPLYSMTDERGRVFEHRLVVARQLGRPLSSTEQVHHIDGDRSHNVIENLLLIPSWSDHMHAERLQVKLVASWAEIVAILFPTKRRTTRRHVAIPQHNLVGAGPIRDQGRVLSAA